MLTRTVVAFAIAIGAVSGALATTKQYKSAPHHDVYDVRGGGLGSDPDPNVRFELQRDQGRGQAS